ncbi:12770_t:CDS:2, partial [Gigaspora rosea]
KRKGIIYKSVLTADSSNSQAHKFTLHGRVLSIVKAIDRDEAHRLMEENKNKKQKEDQRNHWSFVSDHIRVYTSGEGLHFAWLPLNQAAEKVLYKSREQCQQHNRPEKNGNGFLSPLHSPVMPFENPLYKMQLCEHFETESHNAAIVKIHLGHLIEKKNFSTIKQRGQKRTIYFYDKASAEDWKNYTTVFQSSLKDNQAIKKINIVQSGTVVGKKKLDQAWDVIHNTIIKAANQTLPRKKVLNTGCNRKKSRTKMDLEKSILDLGKNPRYRKDMLQDQNLDEEEQDLRRWKKILEKKCLLENT